MSSASGIENEVVEARVKDCAHYKRGCSFVSPCCGKVYGCRLCHDDKELSHSLDRYAVTEVVCKECSTRQPVSNTCSKCSVVFGKYYCSVCHLYDNQDKGQFHCNKCGLCRIGGADRFFHCDNCGFCLDNSMLETHRCRQDNSKNNCPVCMEDIHTSRDAAHVPKCGHLLHGSCFQECLKKGIYQCPQCQTSLADMKMAWASKDMEISSWEMPEHLKTFKVKVMCRDCQVESDTVFHIMGLKCMGDGCGSYNTVRCGKEEIPQDAVPIRAAEFMQYVQGLRENSGRQEEGGQDDGGGSDDNDSDHEYATAEDSNPENSNSEGVSPEAPHHRNSNSEDLGGARHEESGVENSAS